MCCSGKHPHHHNPEDPSNQRKEARRGLHLPLMMLCCLLPLASVYLLGASGFSGTLRNALPLLMIGLCIVPHLLMGRHSSGKARDCGKEDPHQSKLD